ncbi:MAG: hypothetical protein WD604_03960, partial [Balneolaceae bacterium]
FQQTASNMSNLKRIHLFEFEDLDWFPQWLRQCMTRLIVVMHNLLGTHKKLAELVYKSLNLTGQQSIIDLCTGSGGPMLKVYEILKTNEQTKAVTLTLTDLYPDKDVAGLVNNKDTGITYLEEPVDATQVDGNLKGVRTMTGSFHHFKPETAKKILEDAQYNRQPICIFEISDNSVPTWLWWIAIPVNFIMAFFITPFARPVTWKQLFFTYLIPVIPLCFAWDGAVSNVRTYTLNDLDILLSGMESDKYKWEKGKIPGKTNKIYLLGLPAE